MTGLSLSDLPPEIVKLCRVDSPISDLRLGEWSCYFKTLGLELRFVKTVDDEKSDSVQPVILGAGAYRGGRQ